LRIGSKQLFKLTVIKNGNKFRPSQKELLSGGEINSAVLRVNKIARRFFESQFDFKQL
jgi:hypothetical protein